MTYRDYRSFGHGRFVAFTLSVHPALFLGAAFAIGLPLGWFLA